MFRFIAAIFITLIAATSVVSSAPEQTSPPNFLFILVDDLGWRDLGCYGSTFYETPHIDRLAAEGMRFTSAYAAAPVCSPTRASLLTGKNPARLGFTGHITSILQYRHPPRQPHHPAAGPHEAAAERDHARGST